MRVNSSCCNSLYRSRRIALLLVLLADSGRRSMGRLQRPRRPGTAASTSSSSPATKNIARKKRCRSSARSLQSIMDSIAGCCLRSIRKRASINPNNRQNIPGIAVDARRRPDHCFLALARFAGRRFANHRRISESWQAGDWNPHRDARVQVRRPIRSGPTTATRTRATKKNGRAGSAASCLASIGSIITASTSTKARAASLRPARPIIRSCAGSRMARFGDRPMSTAFACRCRAIRSRSCWAQVIARKGQYDEIGQVLRHATG